MDVRKRLGRNVKRLRRQLGWSQEELAEHSKLHRTYISGIERGIRNPTITIVDRVAHALDCPIGQLVDLDE